MNSFLDALNAEGLTALALCVKLHGDDGIGCTTLLLEQKCNPNVLHPLTGDTPLHYAIRGSAWATAKILLAHGANPGVYNASGVRACKAHPNIPNEVLDAMNCH